MSKKINPLLDTLRGNLVSYSPEPLAPAPLSEVTSVPITPFLKKQTKTDATASKISVSVYPKDIERLDELKDYMKKQGIRNISDSEALRIACRALTLSSQCVDVYHEMQKEDGRRKEKVAS
jgi:hypothetical protein